LTLTYLAALVAALVFAAGLRLLKLVPIAAKAVDTARGATRAMQDATLSDAVKERAVRQASITLMGQFLTMVARAALAAAASVISLAAFSTAGLAPWRAVMHVFATWQGLALASAATVLVAVIKSKP
jgi:hypothetical protein